ncbi:MAG TPA: PAS domain S-box protein [Spirochaetota bacterium]|nr:PAS domain S-box protein [Spirochaetota bacterium]
MNDHSAERPEAGGGASRTEDTSFELAHIRYQELLQSICEGYYECDLSGRVTFCNDSFARMVGLPVERLVGAPYRTFIEPDDIGTVEPLFLRILKSGETERFSDWRMRSQSGARVYVEGMASLIRDARGAPIGFRGIVRDISTFMAVHEDLVRSEQRFFDFLESLPEIVFEMDMKGNFLYVNRRGCEVMGYSRAEIMCMNALDILRLDERERASRGIIKTMLGKRYSAIEYTFHRKDGSWLPVHVYARQVVEGGEVIGIRGIAIDATELKEAERAILESEERFRTMIEHSTEMISILDWHGVIRYQSQSTRRILGYSPEELVGRRFVDLVHDDDAHQVVVTLTGSLKRMNEEIVAEYRFRDREGHYRVLESTGVNLKNSLINGILLNTRDITDRKAAEYALRKREERFRSMYNNAIIGLMTIDRASTSVLTTNEIGFRIFGCESNNEFLGVSLGPRFVDSDAFAQFEHEVMEHGVVNNHEIEIRRTDGSSLWTEMSGKHLTEADNIELAIIDISKRKKAEEQVAYFSFYDRLTGLPNRELISNRIQTEMLKARRKGSHVFFVLCIGIDRFKFVNDMSGTAAGDQVIIKAAGRLKMSFGGEDLVARLDGDKFVAVYSDAEDTGDVLAAVQKAMTAFADPFVIDGSIFPITASIGVSVYPVDGTAPNTLIKNSESAMYLAKEQGRNGYRLFDVQLNAQMRQRLQLEAELQRAIYQNEFVAFYQPKVLQNGRIMGMESLIRWQSPTRGLVPPMQFIPIVESNGMIRDIGSLILLQSCRQNRLWQDAGHPPVKVAVNLSPIQFRQPDLIDSIARIVKDTALDPRWLELEITESGIMENEKENIERLSEIHRMGISISIDDFGTGYSSLSKLRDYPIDTLKIDKSFIEKLPADDKSATIATTIIDLAHNLGFMVVAEGVESSDQLAFLDDRRCDQYQGYFFSKPLPPDEFEKKLRAS